MNQMTNVQSDTAKTTAELVERARELGPLLKKNAAQGEANRRVVEESIEAMAKAGLFKVCTPKRYGGYQLNVRAMLDVAAAVAESDGGTAWVVNLTNVCNWLVGVFPAEDAGRDIRREPRRARLRRADAKRDDDQGSRRISASPANGITIRAAGMPTGPLVGLPVVNDAGEMIDQGVASDPDQPNSSVKTLGSSRACGRAAASA